MIIDPGTRPLEEWRKGVTTMMRVSALTGATRLTVFEQWCDPGCGAPTHRHDVEEVLTVVEGTAEVWCDGETATVPAGQSVLVPAGVRHGFRNTGQGVLHMHAILAAPVFEASFDDRTETSRRWAAG